MAAVIVTIVCFITDTLKCFAGSKKCSQRPRENIQNIAFNVLKCCYFFKWNYLKNEAPSSVFYVRLISTGFPLSPSISSISFFFFTVFFMLISFLPLLDLIPSYFLSPPSFSFSCLTQEAVISKRSVLADIFHGTSLISTPRVAIGQQKLPPFPTNPP